MRPTPSPDVVDSALKRLRERPVADPVVLKVFGSTFMQQLDEVFLDEDAIELDELQLTGELTEVEFYSWLAVSPMAQLHRRRVLEFAATTADILRPKLPYYLGRGLNLRRGVFTPGPVLDLMALLAPMVAGYGLGDVETYRDTRSVEFLHAASQRIGIDALNAADPLVRPAIRQSFVGLGSVEHPTNILLKTATGFASGLRKYPEASASFFRAASELPPPPSFYELEQRSQLQRIVTTTRTIGGATVHILGDDLDLFDTLKVSTVCYVRVRFDDAPMSEGPSFRRVQGGYDRQVAIPIDVGAPVFALDRSLGELVHAGTFIPLHEVRHEQLPHDRYDALRNAVFTVLDQALTDFAPTPAPAPSENLWEQFVAPVPASSPVGEPELLAMEPVRHLRGLRPVDVFRALERLCGPPVRTTGSHRIYRGPTGKTVPLQFTRGDIPAGTLTKVLRLLEIDVRLFRGALLR